MKSELVSTEEWKPVYSYEDYYEVSSKGRVRSLDRSVATSNGKVVNYKSKLLKTFTNQKGNPCVSLSRDGIRNNVVIKHLVYATFSGDYEQGCIITPSKTDIDYASLKKVSVEEWNKLRWTEEARKNATERFHRTKPFLANLGKKLSEETRKKMSDSHKKRHSA